MEKEPVGARNGKSSVEVENVRLTSIDRKRNDVP